MKIKIDKLEKPFILRIEENGEGIISLDGGVFSLNELSVKIILGLNENKNYDTLVSEICSEYNVDKNEVIDDVKNFIYSLVDAGIINKMHMQEIGC